MAAVLIFVVLWGLVLGSFFNVLIVRLPAGTLFKHARSVCPHCGHLIRARDNIPLLSFVLLKARCRDCGQAISLRYPLVEALTAGLLVLLFLAQPWSFSDPSILAWQAGASLILLFLVPASFIDLEHRILPDVITLGGLLLALLLSLLPGARTPLQSLSGALCGGGLLFLVGVIGGRIWKREAMGGGDIKLMALSGALLGPAMVLLALFLGSLIGAIAGTAHKIKTGQSDFPFGPALSAGVIAAWCFGERLLTWYGSLWGL